MLWLTSGVGEWWSLTLAERKKLVEIAIEEARAVAPETVIQVCTSTSTAKDTVELTLHAQEHGADICYLQTPPIEVHGGAGVLRFYQYVADRTDIALGIFNSPSSGYVLTPAEVAELYRQVPAVVAIKEGNIQYWRSRAIHALVPELIVWECDLIVYRAGWLQQGIVGPAQLGTTGYLNETPEHRWLHEYWSRIWAGEIKEAIAYSAECGLDTLGAGMASAMTKYPQRPDYFTHWGASFRYAASVLGLPMGDYPHSRPPQAILPDHIKDQIRTAYEKSGLVKVSALA
jgi:4-hydroxy-tetrahydrodipicolinate synthase